MLYNFFSLSRLMASIRAVPLLFKERLCSVKNKNVKKRRCTSETNIKR